MRATQAVWDILQNYDEDQKYPVYGFGARLPNTEGASHCFALNGDIFNPEVAGIDGILNVYRSAIRKADFYGPTNFAEFLAYINGYCEA